MIQWDFVALLAFPVDVSVEEQMTSTTLITGPAEKLQTPASQMPYARPYCIDPEELSEYSICKIKRRGHTHDRKSLLMTSQVK